MFVSCFSSRFESGETNTVFKRKVSIMSKKVISVSNVSAVRTAKASRKPVQFSPLDETRIRRSTSTVLQAMKAMDAALGGYLIWTPIAFDLARNRMDDNELEEITSVPTLVPQKRERGDFGTVFLHLNLLKY